jgi:hypothetical protein
LSSPSELKSAAAAATGGLAAFLAARAFLDFFAFCKDFFEIGFSDLGMLFLLRALAALAF